MPEEFDSFLASSLAPGEREPDRAFVVRVQARIALEQRLEAQRHAMLTRLAQQLIAVAAVAGAIWWIGRTPIIASWFSESPGLGLVALIATFVLLIAILSIRPDGEPGGFSAI